MALNDNKSNEKPGRTNSAIRPAGNPRPEDRKDDHLPMFSMMGIRARLLHSNFIKVVMGLLIIIFAFTFVISSLTGGGPSGIGGPTGADHRYSGPVATVGTENIDYDRFINSFLTSQQQMAKYQHTDATGYLEAEQRALQPFVEDAALYLKASEAGLTASSEDIDKDIEKRIDDMVKGQSTGDNEAAFRRQMEREFGSVEKFREEQRAKFDRDAVGRQVVIDKLEKKSKAEVKMTEEDFKRSVTKLKLRQIVIRPKFAAFNKDPKEQKAAEEKNEQEAKSRADKLAAQVKTALTPQQFGAIAMKESDDEPSKKKGGQIDEKLPSELPFGTNIKDELLKADAKTKVIGPLQDENTKYFYVLYIEGRKLDLPKDYERFKKEKIKKYEDQRAEEAWGKYKTELTKGTKPVLVYPALAAFKIQTEDVRDAATAEQDGLRKAAIAKYQEALPYAIPREAAAIYYQISQLYLDLKQADKQLEALQEAVKKDPSDIDLHIRLATALGAAKKKDEALKELAAASKELDTNPPPSMFGPSAGDGMRNQIAAQYDLLDKKDLAAAERAKVKPAPQGGMGGMGGMGGFSGMGGAGSPIQISPSGGGSSPITINPSGGGKSPISVKPSGGKAVRVVPGAGKQR